MAEEKKEVVKKKEEKKPEVSEKKVEVAAKKVEAPVKPVETKAAVKPVVKPAVSAPAKQGDRQPFRRNTSKIRPKRKRDSRRRSKDNDDGFDHKIINIRRVTRMFKGGRRMRLSVFVVVGNREGTVGVGLGKGADVRSAQEKAVTKAKKNMIRVQLKGNTLPHDIVFKRGAAKVLLKPAAPGTGIVAGSSMRMVAEIAGIKDMLGKIMGTNNQISNAYATIEALDNLRLKRV